MFICKFVRQGVHVFQIRVSPLADLSLYPIYSDNSDGTGRISVTSFKGTWFFSFWNMPKHKETKNISIFFSPRR